MVKVRIHKGAVVHGTFPAGTRIQGKSQVVSVVCLDPIVREVRNYPDPNYSINFHGGYETVGHEVCWVGSGGYWNYANVKDVDVIEGSL